MPALTRGIFSLKQTYEEQSSGNWSNPSDLPEWVLKPNISPSGSGDSRAFILTNTFSSTYSGSNTIIHDWSSNTFSLGHNFYFNTADHAGVVSNANAGYIAPKVNSGAFGYSFASVFKVGYLNNTTSAYTKCWILGFSPTDQGTLSNANYGYFVERFYADSPFRGNRLYRMDFYNDTQHVLIRGLTQSSNVEKRSGSGNKNYGYLVGGKSYFPSPTSPFFKSTIERFEYDSDTENSLFRANSYVMYDGTAFSSSSALYITGGTNNTVPGGFSYVNRVDYANDTSVVSQDNSPIPREMHGSTGNGDSLAMVGGGADGSVALSTVERYSFTNSTWSAQTQFKFPGTSNSSDERTAMFGPRENWNISPNWNFQFSTFPWTLSPQSKDYFSEKAGVFSTNLQINTQTGQTRVNPVAYIGGGVVVRSSEAQFQPAPLFPGTTNVWQYDYWSFGPSSVQITSTIERYDYASDTSALACAFITPPQPAFVPSNQRARGGRIGHRGCGNNLSSYFHGGGGDQMYGDVTSFSKTSPHTYKLDHSNDQAGASLRTVHTFPGQPSSYYDVRGHATVSNLTDWYCIGGHYPSQPAFLTSDGLVNKQSYASDTASFTQGTQMPSPKMSFGISGNGSYAWAQGGVASTWSWPTPATFSSTVDRYDYVNNTWSFRTNGTSGSDGFRDTNMRSIGNLNYMWNFGSGMLFSGCTRFDYSNDTLSFRGKVMGSLVNDHSATFGTGDNGYLITGSTYQSSVPNTTPGSILDYHVSWRYHGMSSIIRVTFANDTATHGKRSVTAIPRDGATATGSVNYGLWPYYTLSSSNGPVPVQVPQSITTNPGPGLVYTRINQAYLVGGWKHYGGMSIPRTNFGNYHLGPNLDINFEDPSSITRHSEKFNLDSSTEMCAPRATMNYGRKVMGTVGNTDYAWFAGGVWSGTNTSSIVERLDYANDTASLSIRTVDLSAPYGARMLSAMSSSTTGYFLGGIFAGTNVPSPTPTANTGTRLKMDFSNETVSAAGGTSVVGAVGAGAIGVSGNGNFGYLLRGAIFTNSSPVNVDFNVLKYNFTNETDSILTNFVTYFNGGEFTAARIGEVVGQSPEYVGLMGGTYSPASGYPISTSTVERLDVFNDTSTIAGFSGLTPSMSGMSVGGYNQTMFYAGGHSTSASDTSNSNSNPMTTISRLNFTNTTFRTDKSLITSRVNGAAVSRHGVYIPPVPSTFSI